MILIIGRFQVQSAKLADFQAFARATVAEERRTPGCTGFEMLQDVTQPDHFVMLEQWRDRASLDHHLTTDAYKHNEAQLNSFVTAEPTWDEYEV